MFVLCLVYFNDILFPLCCCMYQEVFFPSYVCVLCHCILYHISMYLPGDRLLLASTFLALTKNVTLNIGLTFLFKSLLLIILDIKLRVEFLGKLSFY